jgi:hypothetical protein
MLPQPAQKWVAILANCELTGKALLPDHFLGLSFHLECVEAVKSQSYRLFQPYYNGIQI